MPMACEPLAQAPDMVKLIPFKWKITERFMVIVEFMDWKIEPEPTIAVFFLARMTSMASITGAALLSFPYNMPTS